MLFPIGQPGDGGGPLQVTIDIKPGSFPNSVNPGSGGAIPVAILTTSVLDGEPADFDAVSVAPSSVQVGPDGATMVHGTSHLEDVDGDGDLDLVLHFRTRATGIACGDDTASLTGEIFEGQPLAGSDSMLDRLRALGEIDPATADLDDLPEPLVLAPGIEHPSEVLHRLRSNER